MRKSLKEFHGAGKLSQLRACSVAARAAGFLPEIFGPDPGSEYNISLFFMKDKISRILFFSTEARTSKCVSGRSLCQPSVVIMDGQSVKTTERGGVRGFDAHKRVKGRKRHILVDTLGLPIASRVESGNVSDRRAGARLLGGLSALFPAISIVIADAGTRAASSRVS
jgi:hypothetical protein